LLRKLTDTPRLLPSLTLEFNLKQYIIMKDVIISAVLTDGEPFEFNNVEQFVDALEEDVVSIYKTDKSTNAEITKVIKNRMFRPLALKQLNTPMS
jgi:hypothetical protein